MFWLARSKPRVGLWRFGEGFGVTILRVEGTALGWFHRAAITSRSWQWKDHRPVLSMSNTTQYAGPNWTITFFLPTFFRSEQKRLRVIVTFFLSMKPNSRDSSDCLNCCISIQSIESLHAQKHACEKAKDVSGALLVACRIHNLEHDVETVEKLAALESNNAGRYIFLVKMYENVGKLEDAARLRKMLIQRNIRKQAGYSSIEVDCIHDTSYIWSW